MQIIDHAIAFGVRQSGNIVRDLQPFGGDTVRPIHREPDIFYFRCCSVCPGKGSGLKMLISLRVSYIFVSIGQIDALHTRLGQGEQRAVGLQHPQLAEDIIPGIDYAVMVYVQFRQGGKTVNSPHPVGQQGIVAEKLGPIIYDAVAIPVPHQQAVALAHPAGQFRKAVSVIVKAGSGFKPGGIYNSVAIQIQDQRVNPDCFGGSKLVFDGVDLVVTRLHAAK